MRRDAVSHSLQTFDDVPSPSPARVAARTNLINQLWQFIVLNLKMIKMVRKGSH